MKRAGALIGAILWIPAGAFAQSSPDTGAGVEFSFGAGVQVRPEYFGSDEYETQPDFKLSLEEVRFGNGRSFGGDPADGLSFRGSFRSIGERDSDDFGELDGLDDIDRALELGFGIVYTQPGYEVFADLRQGFGGHESLVGEVGADAILRPTDQLSMSVGPRVFFGSDDYAETYFGITEEEAAASDFDAFDPEGGALSAGLEVGVSYRFNDRWSVDGAVAYDRYLGDAADSPIMEEGSEDQYTARVGLVRTFSFGF
ncbi:MipA/OmpV family protein [Aestuariibius insulae]|uniref:MipA/OmpV family protein n=1 Tax=Aestuariibius insulae TaxID=2058287 RepID=UPI00345E06EE